MKLTREQVEEFMADRSVNEVCSDEEIKELCRLALTALSAEPVAWMADDGRIVSAETKETSMPRAAKVSFTIPLYTAPPSLLAENKRLREALELLYEHCRLYHHEVETNNVGEVVRAALKEPK